MYHMVGGLLSGLVGDDIRN